MSVPADKTYPAIATNTTWQKQKSFLDKTKAKTKTGLGAELTKAQAAWAKIPWDALDAAALDAKTITAATNNKKNALLALAKVKVASDAVGAAKDVADKTAVNKGLSKTAAAAAKAIAVALGKAETRLASVKTKDFDDALKTATEKAEALKRRDVVNLRIEAKVSGSKKQVGKANKAVWDQKTLAVADMTWLVGKAADYQGKAVTIYGEYPDGEKEGISRVFQNDMQLKSVSGSKAEFKA